MEKMIVPVILGPTAVGKSAFVMRAAEEFGYEVISCDSRQIYRYMDVGTAKPTAPERERVRHWLIDVLDPSEGYSAFAFAEDALRIIEGARGRGKKILICGGAGLYFYILQSGAPTGVDFRVVAIVRERGVLYDRINRRVDAMIAGGLWDEFLRLRGMGYGEQSPGMTSVGYRELFAVERGEVGMARGVELIKRNSRRYAKRQMTWFRNKTQCERIEAADEGGDFLMGWFTRQGLAG